MAKTGWFTKKIIIDNLMSIFIVVMNRIMTKSDVLSCSFHCFLERFVGCMNIKAFLVLCLITQQLCCHFMKLSILYAPGTMATALQGTIQRRLLVLQNARWLVQVYLWNLFFRVWLPLFFLFSFSLHLFCHEHWLFWVGFWFFVHIRFLHLMMIYLGCVRRK